MAVSGQAFAYGRAVEMLTQFEDYDGSNSRVWVSLHGSAYEPNTSHAYDSDVSGEVSGSNYERKLLQGKSVLFDSATGRFQFAATRVSWPKSTLVARYAVIRFPADSGTPTLLAWVDFGQDLRSTNSTFTLSWEQGMVLEIQGA